MSIFVFILGVLAGLVIGIILAFVWMRDSLVDMDANTIVEIPNHPFAEDER